MEERERRSSKRGFGRKHREEKRVSFEDDRLDERHDGVEGDCVVLETCKDVSGDVNENGIVGPLVVDFAAGDLPINAVDAALEFRAFASGEGVPPHVLVKADGGARHFVGSNFDCEDAEVGSVNYFIGDVDQQGKKVVFKPVQHVFKMRPKFSVLPTVDGMAGEIQPVPDASDKTKYELDRVLLREFGSKKRKAEDRTQEGYKRVSGPDGDIETALSGAAPRNIAQSAVRELSKRLQRDVPPHNAAAQRVEDVYSLSDIISEEDLSFFYRDSALYIAKVIRKQKKESNLKALQEIREAFPEYFFSLLCRDVPAAQSETKAERKRAFVHRASLVSYLSTLVSFHLMEDKKVSFERCQRYLNTSSEMTERLLAQFAVSSQRSSSERLWYRRTPSLLNKLLSHVLVLVLMLNNFEVDVAPLCSTLQMSQKKEVGCVRKVGSRKASKTSSASSPVMVLPVPPVFPKLRLGQPKRTN